MKRNFISSIILISLLAYVILCPFNGCIKKNKPNRIECTCGSQTSDYNLIRNQSDNGNYFDLIEINNAVNLPNDIFKNLKINILFFNGSKFSILPNSFRGVLELNEIYFNKWNKSSLNNGSFLHLKKLLKIFKISQSEVENLHELTTLNQLEHILILNSQIKTLEFKNSNSLKSLVISSSKITNFHLENLSSISNLNLSNLKLVDLNLVNLKNLKELYLDKTKFKSITLRELINLNKISLQNDNISSFNLLKNMSTLTSINLKGNVLKNWDPNVFNYFPKLEILDLSFNQISGNLYLENINTLTYLNIYENKIENLRIFNLSSLNYILLDNNPFRTVIIFNSNLENLFISNLRVYSLIIQQVKTLGHLYLTNCTVYNLALYNLDNLEYLFLFNNSLSILPFFDLPKLKHLDLSYNKLTEDSFSSLRRPMLDLIHLNLSHNLIENLNQKIFKYFTKLEILDLSFNLIQRASFKWYEKNSNLKEIYIGNNYMSQVPDISDLSELNVFNFENQNGRFVEILDYAFSRDRPMSSLSLFINDNIIKKFSSKMFCSIKSDKLSISSIHIDCDLNFMNECFFRSLKELMKNTCQSIIYNSKLTDCVNSTWTKFYEIQNEMGIKELVCPVTLSIQRPTRSSTRQMPRTKIVIKKVTRSTKKKIF
ncbi:unnamed protein product [Brachionus calyciflorus]|uniref:Uncharacterized protein n=1 Tax=Brachionus calyciflorus TaxID=104777 RepID=A0A814I7P7_9BILA|nr:unnamed protein product [Brachionus calyciflorus]